jgi:integrase
MSLREKKEWITYPRASDTKRRSYYAGFLKPDGTYRRVVLHDAYGHPVTSKKIADELALRMFQEGVPGTSEGFGPFLESFWAKGGTYARDKRDQGEPLSVVYQANNYNNVRRHIRPALVKLGKDELPVDRVTPELIKSILRKISDKGLSGRTVNTVRQTMAVPLRIYWSGKMNPERNPLTAMLVPKFDEEPEERQIFNLDEARRFLAHDFGDLRLAAIHRQGAFTGMRLGECLGMYHGDLQPEEVKVRNDSGRLVTVTEYWIDVRHNWQELDGVKGPKRGSYGNIPVPAAIAQQLLALEKASPYGGPFLYWGFQPTRPYPKDKVEQSYNAACRAIGITDADRKRRGLGFHAWRHFFDTYVHIDATTMQKLLRHRSPEMTMHYKHITGDQARAASRAATGLLEAVVPGKKRSRRK